MGTPDDGDDKADIQSSLQDGFSAAEDAARCTAAEAGEATRHTAAEAKAGLHQGLASMNKAGNALADAIRYRPLTALLVAGTVGALAALSRRH